MAKFDQNNNRYQQLWDSVEGRHLITYILNDPNLIHVKPRFWKDNFEVDPIITPTKPDGTASFTVAQRPLEKSTLMHAVAPLGDTITGGHAEAEAYSGSIGQFESTGFVENALERKYRMDLAAQLGTDAQIVDMFIKNVQKMVDDGHMTLDYLSAFALTHGYVAYERGQGLQKKGYYKAPIPATNFCNAGAKVWSDPTCNLITQMRAIEKQKKEDEWGIDVNLKWQFDWNTFHNVFLQNNEVKDYIKDRIALAYPGAKIEKPSLIFDDVRPWLDKIEGVSPIEVVDSKQYDNGSIVSGWDAGKVVLRPQGYAGKIVRTNILDEEVYKAYGNECITRSFGWTADGLMMLENSIHPNGNLKEWHSSVKMAAMPVLDDFLYHVIVDTTTAD